MSSELAIRVVVIDDHEMILQSVERMLRDDPQIVVVGTALDATSGIELTRREQPDIVVIDYTLPDMDAPDAIRMLRKVHPNVKVITFSGSGATRSSFRFHGGGQPRVDCEDQGYPRSARSHSSRGPEFTGGQR